MKESFWIRTHEKSLSYDERHVVLWSPMNMRLGLDYHYEVPCLHPNRTIQVRLRKGSCGRRSPKCRGPELCDVKSSRWCTTLTTSRKAGVRAAQGETVAAGHH